MKRALIVLSVLAVAGFVPAAAHAANWQGAVIAKDAKRRAIVTASRGVVRTVRAPKAFRRIHRGDRVAVNAAALPDGTYIAAEVRVGGKAKRAHVRGVVVKKLAGRLILSAGHSVFPLRLRGAAKMSASNHHGLGPGDEIDCKVRIGDNGLSSGGGDVSEVGHVEELDLEGIYLFTNGSVLDLAVVHRGLVQVTIPDGVTAPEFSPGDEIELTVRVEPDGTFTLISADNEDAPDASSGDSGDSGDAGDTGGLGDSSGDTGGGTDDAGVDMDSVHGEFTVSGLLASISADAVGVQVERHPDPVRCAVPAAVDLSGFTVGDLVSMTCKFVDGRFVLSQLDAHNSSYGDTGASFTVDGFVVSLSSDGIGVTVQGHDAPVTCARAIGQDLLGFAVGDFVEMTCNQDGGAYVLASLYSSHAKIDVDGAEFTLSGVVAAVGPLELSLQVEHHPTPVACAVPSGMDLRGLAPGDPAEIHCHYVDGRFQVASISSNSAYWPENPSADDMPWFTLDGILKSIGTDSVGVQVPHHSDLVRCAMPVGTDLSGFATGDTVELHCHFHDGRWNLAELSSEHSDLTLEP